ncbi:MAG: hypothetical protein GY853_00805 [PVC group bacterium]|nr:hypothetical protein [PVC group bacterium]
MNSIHIILNGIVTNDMILRIKSQANKILDSYYIQIDRNSLVISWKGDSDQYLVEDIVSLFRAENIPV